MVTDEFVALAKIEAQTRGLGDLPLVQVPHPVGSISLDSLRFVAESALDGIIKAVTGPELPADGLPAAAGVAGPDVKSVLQVPAEPSRMLQYFLKRGLSDGLPVIPPTREAVREMMNGFDKDEIVGVIAPLNGIATVEKIAANAVLAGCLPEYFPIVMAAMKAILDPGFNINGVQTTTGNVTPLIVVNGPCRQALEINCSSNVLGQGWRANATIGRAIRLILTNIGGGIPGLYDKATLGQPAKYTFCIAENEEENPWEPLHVERGISRGADAVSVFGCSGVHSIIDMASQTAKGLLKTMALSMMGGATSGVTSSEALIIICPEHAAILSAGGYQKEEIRQELFVRARTPHEKFSEENLELLAKRRPRWFKNGQARELPIVDRPEDIWIVVAGGKGAKSAFIPGRTSVQMQTRLVETRKQPGCDSCKAES
ncbi:MAG: hypothetical protein HY695_13250 [Deltaproteobacteria bacterium]|nr:hypothetical protein [Deltaproteobacteria bacterium]